MGRFRPFSLPRPARLPSDCRTQAVWHGKSHTWAKMPWLREEWRRISGGKPFGIKGIQHVDDARRAKEIGCEFIVVSNHAGRQVDGAVGSLEVLPEIVDAVGKGASCFSLS